MISVFDLFTIGIGPSAPHTVAPMRAAYQFVCHLRQGSLLENTSRICVKLHGSLAYTGKGHGSDKAILAGLRGEKPDIVDPTKLDEYYQYAAHSGKIKLLANKELAFTLAKDLLFIRKKNASNLICFSAYDVHGKLCAQKTYRSLGGGFLCMDEEKKTNTSMPYSFKSAEELLEICTREKMSISQIALANEQSRMPLADIRRKLDDILCVMREAIARGIGSKGYLPGSLKVARRAPALYEKLQNDTRNKQTDHLHALDWVNLFAIAVSEENASGHRVVASPTNGAAGIIPAIVNYFEKIYAPPHSIPSHNLLLSAGCIGMLYKMNASISGAEVGCQGEVGVASSMAAAGLTEILGGTPEQVEQAAEIAIEHSLGLTCDPIGGLVQIPCIERNAVGAVKAINASRLSLQGTGKHFVTLDKAIKTMLETGLDMREKYKETARGGLAVNVVEC